MNRIREILLGIIASLVLLLFGAGIGAAAFYTVWIENAPQPNLMPAIVTYFVSAVSGTLAANLGAVLGISAVRRAWDRPETLTEAIQWIAACWYVVMLFVAAVAWGITGFTEDRTRVVALLPDLTKTGIGIFIAVLAAVLGVQAVRSNTRDNTNGR